MMVIACAAVLLLLGHPQAALGITSDPKCTVSPTPAGAGQYASYLIGPFDVGNAETITKVAVTFPNQCNVSAAQPVTTGDTVSVSGQTVTVTFGTPKVPGSVMSFRVGNVRNPATAGSYVLANPIVFTASNGAVTNLNLQGKRGTFKIMTSPYLLLTIETPDDTQTVDFGSVDPGVAAPSKNVIVTVDSSVNFLISLALSGDVSPMGLTVTPPPATVQTAGVRTYTSVYGVTPPWATTPDVQLNVDALYTVTQQ